MLVLGALLVVGGNSAFAQFIFTFDENGNANFNGQPTPYSMTVEPISQMLALTYSLGMPTVAGDVVLTEPAAGSIVANLAVVSDIVRFDAQGNVYFFSDNTDAGSPPDLADVGLPVQLLSNVATIAEVGSEGNNGAVWIPLAGQPGSLAAGGVIQYNIISDVPEPGTMLLGGLGGGLLFFLRSRRQAGRN